MSRFPPFSWSFIVVALTLAYAILDVDVPGSVRVSTTVTAQYVPSFSATNNWNVQASSSYIIVSLYQDATHTYGIARCLVSGCQGGYVEKRAKSDGGLVWSTYTEDCRNTKFVDGYAPSDGSYVIAAGYFGSTNYCYSTYSNKGGVQAGQTSGILVKYSSTGTKLWGYQVRSTVTAAVLQ
jgi:hypothetical protein